MEASRREPVEEGAANINNKRAQAQIELSANFDYGTLDGVTMPKDVKSAVPTKTLDSFSPAELIIKKHRARQELLGNIKTTNNIQSLPKHLPPGLARLTEQALSRSSHTINPQTNKKLGGESAQRSPGKIVIPTAKKTDPNQNTTSKKVPPKSVPDTPDAGIFKKYRSNSKHYIPANKVKNNESAQTNTEDLTSSVESAEHEEASLADILLAERKKRGVSHHIAPKKEQHLKTKLIIFMFVFFLGGLGILGFFLWDSFIKVPQLQPSTPIYEPVSLIRADNVEFLRIIQNKETISSFLSIAKNLVPNTKLVTHIALVNDTELLETQTQIGTDELLFQINARAPEPFVRSLNNHMLGLFAGDQTGVFLFLKTTSFSNAFAGILSWEESTLNEFAFALGGIEPPEEQEMVWSDESILNIDVRVLRSSSFDDYLFYTFLDKETLLLTTTQETFLEAVSRFQTPGKVLR